MKKRLFVDMDGVLTEFKRISDMSVLYTQKYFENLLPHENLLGAVRNIVLKKEIDVFILSSYLSDSAYAKNEKNTWLDKNIPEIDAEHRIFVPNGENKANYVPNKISSDDFLIDDFTENLNKWKSAGGRCVKIINEINNTKRTWRGNKIRFDKSASILETNLSEIILEDAVFLDENPVLRPIVTILDNEVEYVDKGEELTILELDKILNNVSADNLAPGKRIDFEIKYEIDGNIKCFYDYRYNGDRLGGLIRGMEGNWLEERHKYSSEVQDILANRNDERSVYFTKHIECEQTEKIIFERVTKLAISGDFESIEKNYYEEVLQRVQQRRVALNTNNIVPAYPVRKQYSKEKEYMEEQKIKAANEVEIENESYNDYNLKNDNVIERKVQGDEMSLRTKDEGVKYDDKKDINAVGRRQYYKIDEKTAKLAHNMRSFREYKENSTTDKYHSDVDEVYNIADEVASKKPERAEKAYNLASKYSKLLAGYYNRHNTIGTMCPSEMIVGGGNFSVHKKEKQNEAFAKNFKNLENIENLKEEIQEILHTNTQPIIRINEENAVEKLEMKLKELEEYQTLMKDVNAYYRKNNTLEGCTLLDKNQRAEIEGYIKNRVQYKPYTDFELTGNNNKIKSTRQRLAELLKEKEQGVRVKEGKFFKVVENTDIMRLQLEFEEKPNENVRTVLKKNGFKWSPSNSVWQRQLTNNARYSLERVIKELEVIQETGKISINNNVSEKTQIEQTVKNSNEIVIDNYEKDANTDEKYNKYSQKDELFEKVQNICENFKIDENALKEYLKFQAHFYKYSSLNTILIHNQNGGATFVQSFNKWKADEYSVKKGEKGLVIRVPAPTKFIIKENESIQYKYASKELKEAADRGIYKIEEKLKYVKGYVFDISQTNYPVEEYPKIFDRGYKDEKLENVYEGLKKFAEKNLKVEIVEADLKSISIYGNVTVESNEEGVRKISISDTLNDSQKVVTLAHEIGHVITFEEFENEIKLKSTAHKEFEADCFQVMLCERLGIEDASDNMHLSNQYKKLLEENNNVSPQKVFDYIQKVFKGNWSEIDKEINIAVNNKIEQTYTIKHTVLLENTNGNIVECFDKYLEYKNGQSEIPSNMSKELTMTLDNLTKEICNNPSSIKLMKEEMEKMANINPNEKFGSGIHCINNDLAYIELELVQ